MSEQYEPWRRLWENIDDKIGDKIWIALGVVNSVRESDRRVRVNILPGLELTNWLRVYYLNAGSNFQSGQMPDINSEVVLMFLGGDPNSAFVLSGGFVQNSDNPPALTDSAGVLISDKFGNQIYTDSRGVNVISTNINLGTTGLGSSNGIVRQSDLQAVVTVLNNLITAFNSHTQPTPAGPSGPPVSPFTSTASANSSSVAKAQ